MADSAAGNAGCVDATAFVLAGGESSRIGRDKALLALPAGETMLERALAVAQKAAGTVMLVAPAGRYPQVEKKFRTIQDVYPGRGPLAGIHAALLNSATDLNVILGVDCPLITPELLRFLLHTAAGTAALAVVPRVRGHLHTVCAVYRKAFVQAVERDLRSAGQQPGRDEGGGEARSGTRIERLLAQVPGRIVEEGELRAAGFAAELFTNVNTLADFAALASLPWDSGTGSAK
jgi:molybdopterin-guanine dinucleotide biosynthesis protein A